MVNTLPSLDLTHHSDFDALASSPSAATVPSSPIPAFIDREREYRFLAVVPESLDGKPFTNPAVLCASYTDEEFFKFRCNSIQAYILVLAAKSLGDEVHNNFLDHTFLADRKTTIHQYFEKVSTCILEEEPPESLKTRYGG
ncbi:hypothetical protein D0Y65_044714 [Glycine soja]|uniref:Uncharacterized protein n=1 Tax=Glycine soja TaxID=3848 RepID=A0A445G1K1_GLYSO|nr:hypothetical protein D0Y65_044714 [Glycine soja]